MAIYGLLTEISEEMRKEGCKCEITDGLQGRRNKVWTVRQDEAFRTNKQSCEK